MTRIILFEYYNELHKNAHCVQNNLGHYFHISYKKRKRIVVIHVHENKYSKLFTNRKASERIIIIERSSNLSFESLSLEGSSDMSEALVLNLKSIITFKGMTMDELNEQNNLLYFCQRLSFTIIEVCRMNLSYT